MFLREKWLLIQLECDLHFVSLIPYQLRRSFSIKIWYLRFDPYQIETSILNQERSDPLCDILVIFLVKCISTFRIVLIA